MRKAYLLLRFCISMVVSTAVAWHGSRRLVIKRRLLRARHEARLREAHAVYPKEDPRSTSFAFWMREAFAEHYGHPTDPERLAHRNRAILGTARELLEDMDPPLQPEDVARHIRHIEEQLGRMIPQQHAGS